MRVMRHRVGVKKDAEFATFRSDITCRCRLAGVKLGREKFGQSRRHIPTTTTTHQPHVHTPQTTSLYPTSGHHHHHHHQTSLPPCLLTASTTMLRLKSP